MAVVEVQLPSEQGELLTALTNATSKHFCMSMRCSLDNNFICWTNPLESGSFIYIKRGPWLLHKYNKIPWAKNFAVLLNHSTWPFYFCKVEIVYGKLGKLKVLANINT